MGNLTLNGATSGSITLAPTAVAGTNTLTLPAATGTVLTTAGGQTVSGNTTVSGTVVMGSPFTMRNKIINGAMVIDQRNAGASVTQGLSAIYITDRWYCAGTVASKFTVQQNAGSVTPPAGFSNYLGVTSSSAYTIGASDNFTLNQPVEGFNIADLAWGTASAKTITLSFWVRSSLTGTFGGSFINATATRSYPFSYTISSANTWTQISITVAGDTTGTWATNNTAGVYVIFSLGSGSTFTAAAGSWAAGNYQSATGATSVVGTNGATFYITGVQLEIGTAATPFEYRNYQQELAMCQRYFVKSYDTSTVPGTVTQNGAIQINASATSFNGCCNTTAAFPSEMRTAGTATYYSPITGASGKAGVIGGADFTAQGTVGTRNISMSTTTGPASATVQMTYHYTVSSEL